MKCLPNVETMKTRKVANKRRSTRKMRMRGGGGGQSRPTNQEKTFFSKNRKPMNWQEHPQSLVGFIQSQMSLDDTTRISIGTLMLQGKIEKLLVNLATHVANFPHKIHTLAMKIKAGKVLDVAEASRNLKQMQDAVQPATDLVNSILQSFEGIHYSENPQKKLVFSKEWKESLTEKMNKLIEVVDGAENSYRDAFGLERAGVGAPMPNIDFPIASGSIPLHLYLEDPTIKFPMIDGSHIEETLANVGRISRGNVAKKMDERDEVKAVFRTVRAQYFRERALLDHPDIPADKRDALSAKLNDVKHIVKGALIDFLGPILVKRQPMKLADAVHKLDEARKVLDAANAIFTPTRTLSMTTVQTRPQYRWTIHGRVEILPGDPDYRSANQYNGMPNGANITGMPPLPDVHLPPNMHVAGAGAVTGAVTGAGAGAGAGALPVPALAPRRRKF